MSHIDIDREKCTACGLCVEVCPQDCFAQPTAEALPEMFQIEECIACGHCVAVCPADAVDHREFPSGSVRPVSKGILPGPESLMEVFRARRSVREFKDEAVDGELIKNIIEAARLAPSAHNNQSTEYLVITAPGAMAKMAELTVTFLAKTAKMLRHPVGRRIALLIGGSEVKGALTMLDDFNRVVEQAGLGRDRVLHNAPAVILFHGEKAAVYSHTNAQLAIQNAALMAAGLGLGAFYTGYVVAACTQERKIPDLVGIPKRHSVHGGLALGWPRLQYKKWPDKRPARVRWI